MGSKVVPYCNKFYASIKLCQLDSFGDFKTLCDLKLCVCIVRKIH